MAIAMNKNVTNVALEQLWSNLNTRILPKKVDAQEGYGLSKNDFTDALLSKLNGIEDNANLYVHPKSGIVAGTYRSVTVDENGHVTAATNPDTLEGYGVTSVPVDLLTGVINIANIPHAALERCVVVADDTARFALTEAEVQVGDTVKVVATGTMYFVKDASKLSSEEGYEVYTAGTAAAVEWSGVLNKPETFTPSAHTHAVAEITDFPTALKNPNAVTFTTALLEETETGEWDEEAQGYKKELTFTPWTREYDGSSTDSIDVVETVASTLAAINNGLYESKTGVGSLVMTASEVDAMMGLS